MSATLPAALTSVEEDVALLLEDHVPLIRALAARVREIRAKGLSERMESVCQHRDGRLMLVEPIRPERPVWVRSTALSPLTGERK